MAIYYVDPSGNDASLGTITQPWKTWNRADASAFAGDTVYFRGGTYNISTNNLQFNHSGTKDNPIRFFNYPNEIPIFDGSTRRVGGNYYALRILQYNFIHVKGMKFINFQQITYDPSVPSVHDIVVGVYTQYAHDITIENCIADNIWGNGFQTHSCSSIFYINCDALNCADPLRATPGNGGAGYSFTGAWGVSTGRYTYTDVISYEGCRAWRCSDDGFHGDYEGLVKFDRCWAFQNGFLLPDGAGNGFKVAYIHDVSGPLQRKMTNSIASHNEWNGYHENNYGTDGFGRLNSQAYNNIFCYNENGIYIPATSLAPLNQNIYRNNISFGNTNVGVFTGPYVHDHNSWDSSLRTAVVGDFVSFDVSQLQRPRKSDFSLPDVSFGHLTTNASLLYAGIWVDVSLDGENKPWKNPPSLGAYEYGNVYYVATDGSDGPTVTGSISDPWFDPEHACQHLNAGDILYIRGGTYYGVENNIQGDGHGDRHVLYINGSDPRWKQGTALNPIIVQGYPPDIAAGNRVIFDGSTLTSTWEQLSNVYAEYTNYWYFIDIDSAHCISHAGTYSVDGKCHGFYLKQCTHCKFERCRSYSNEGYGFMIYGGNYAAPKSCDGCSIINCDAYDNYDEYNSEPGNTADGISITGLSPSDNCYIRGCRSWHNSDDGIDVGWTGARIYFENCWTFNNGYGDFGAGNGLKYGHAYDASATPGVINRIVTGCIAYNNIKKAFQANDSPVALLEFCNNLAFGNATGWPALDQSNTIDGSAIIRNNIIDTPDGNSAWDVILKTANIQDHNSWNMPPCASAVVGLYYYARTNINSSTQFVSYDASQLIRPRKSDGSLPDVSFGHLTPNSSYIYKGVYVSDVCTFDGAGLPWKNPPSLGAFEYGYSLPSIDTSLMSFIYTVSASCGGRISADGSLAIIKAGVCVSTNANPTVLDVSTKDSSAVGVWYSSSLTGLNPSTHYHVRAYAYNSLGVSYGVDVSFNTLPTSNASIYFVATDGSDSYTGAIAKPWKTWQYGVNQLNPGDTLYIKGGTYYPNASNAMINITGKSGTAVNPIKVYAYPPDYEISNIPILDCSILYGRSALWIYDVSYWYFKGLTVCNAKQYPGTASASSNEVYGFTGSRCKSISFDQCVAHNIEGYGFEFNQGDGGAIYFTNCDAYNNCDYQSDRPGNDSGGFPGTGWSPASASTLWDPIHWQTFYVTGCRSWNNGDSGFGVAYGCNAIFDSCWAIYNGKLDGDGKGFSVGLFLPDDPSFPNFIIKNCLSIFNRSIGFRLNASYDPIFPYTRWYNNTGAFNSDWNFQGGYGPPQTGGDAIFRNNIGYGHSTQIGWGASCNFAMMPDMVYTSDHNSWDVSMGMTLSASDFISLPINVSDAISAFCAPRKSDGSLPDVSAYFKLSSTSQAKWKGTYISDVSVVYDSANVLWHNPPSLGMFEYTYSLPSVDTSSMSLVYTVSASCGGRITSDGSLSIIKAGICVSTNANPTVLDTSTKDSSVVGSWYSSSLTGLNPSTHYHVRAYAYNSAGVTYGTDVSFNTLPTSNASIYFVATDGSNNYNGSIATPWRTWNYALIQLKAGDVLYVRGGTYYPDTSSAYIDIGNSTRKGTQSNPINIVNYPGETPIFDASLLYRSSGFWVHDTSYWNIVGLTVCNAWQDGLTTKVIGFNTSRADQIRFTNCVAHDNGGPGFLITGNGSVGGTYYITNCDSYNNCDYDTPGGGIGNDGDGFQMANYTGYLGDPSFAYWTVAHFEGCRAWNNSDDGFDFVEQCIATVNSCWSMNNGRLNGDGNGMKAGILDYAHPPSQQYIYTNNICTGNYYGFRNNSHADLANIDCRWYNNFAYDNSFYGFDGSGPDVSYNEVIIFRNNIAYPHVNKGGWLTGDSQFNMEPGMVYTTDHNSWDTSMNLTVVNSYFVNLDVSQLYRSRKSDGALPDVSFGHLTANSSLIYAGIWVDVSLDGEGTSWHNPPSLGAFEYDSSAADASTSVPTVTTAAVTDISIYTATGGGNVTHDGSISLTYRGICWSTSASPTTLNASTLDASTGEGAYTLGITGLNASTHYFVRAFAYNSVGISYGIDVSFNTYAAPNVSTGVHNLFLSPGNKYYTYNGKYLIR